MSDLRDNPSCQRIGLWTVLSDRRLHLDAPRLGETRRALTDFSRARPTDVEGDVHWSGFGIEYGCCGQMLASQPGQSRLEVDSVIDLQGDRSDYWPVSLFTAVW